MNSREEGHLSSDESLFGASVHTWGTKSSTSNGMVNFLDQLLFGGNVGHASINMKLPVTESTKQWIEHYCCCETYQEIQAKNNHPITFNEYLEQVDKRIPVSQKNHIVRKAKYNEDGQMTPSSQNAYEQTYFEIDFSWWPGRLQVYNQDLLLERQGVHFDYQDQWRDYLQPEERVLKGKLGQREMTYAPATFIHQRDLPEILVQRATHEARLSRIDNDLQLVRLLSEKVSEIHGMEISKSLHSMFKNLELDYDEILEEYNDTLSSPDFNLEQFIAFCTMKINERGRHLNVEKEDIERILETRELDNLISRVEEIQEQLKIITTDKEALDTKKITKDLEQIHSLIDHHTDKTIPYYNEVKIFITRYAFLRLQPDIEYSSLSPQSIEQLLKKIDVCKPPLMQAEQQERAQDKKIVDEYEKICSDYANDPSGLEEALWDFSYDEEDINTRKQRLANPGTKLLKLDSIQKILAQHKDSGLKVTGDFVQELDNALPSDWRNELEEPCENISHKSMEELINTVRSCASERLKQEKELDKTEAELKKELEQINIDIAKLNQFSDFYSANRDVYIVAGLPPDHEVKLPFNTKGNRGLDPLAMLQKMYEITSPAAEKFDLYRKNCSLASTEVLMAGTKHDSQLHVEVSSRVFGFFGTPQQVLENTKNTVKNIAQNKSDNLFNRIAQINYLDQILGYGIRLYMDKGGSRWQKTAGIGLIVVASLLKLPFVIISALINPIKALTSLTNLIKLIFERNSTALKVGVLIVSLPALVVLAPLSLIQSGLKRLIMPFQSLYNLITSRPKESTDVIDRAIGTQDNNQQYNNTKLARLLNSKIAQTVTEHTITITEVTNPKQILDQFETLLAENPDKIVVLSDTCYSKLQDFVQKSDDEHLKQRFYTCCTTSLNRVKEHMPKNRDEIDSIVHEVAEPDSDVGQRIDVEAGEHPDGTEREVHSARRR